MIPRPQPLHLHFGRGDRDHDDDGDVDVEAGFVEEGDVQHDGPVAPDEIVEDRLRHGDPHHRVHDAVEHGSVPPSGVVGAKDAAAESGAVDLPGAVGAEAKGGGGREGFEEVRGRGGEFAEDLVVGVGPGEDGLAGEEVGVDDGEVVGGGVEEGGDGGFTGGEGTG